MRGRRTMCILMIALLLCTLGSASAEGAYQAFCTEAGLASTDLTAWLEIPGAAFCQPVMQHPQDDAFYSKHDAEGHEASGGTLYTQAGYNANDFSDPVTVIYGSSTNEAMPFGKLQELYSGSFEQCRTIYLHLPDETREYIVFAAIPYSSVHILHYYDFRTARRFTTFFDGVFSTRALGMHLDESNRPEPSIDQVLILSTALRGDKTQRYLVMAKQVSQ